MKLRIALVLLSCALSIIIGLSLARSGRQVETGDPSARKPLIGLSMDTLKEERWVGDRDRFVARAAELGAEVLVQSANGDDMRQLADIDALISRKVDVIVIIPHDGAAMAEGVARAHAANIPVISYDRLITNSEPDIYLTFDNVKVGRLQGQYLIDRLSAAGGGAPKRIVRIYGSKTDNNALLFKQGQDEALAPHLKSGAIQVIHEDWAVDWRPENAKRIANAAITNAGREIDGILASNDGTAGGAIQALVEEGLAGKVLVTGQDAELAACQRIVAGTQAMTIYKPLSRLANRAAELAVALARRKPVVAQSQVFNGKAEIPSVLLEVISVTRENIDETVIKDGFHSREAVYKGQP